MSIEQQLDLELWKCLLWRDLEGEREAFVLPEFSAQFFKVTFRDLCITTCIAGHWTWPAYSSRGSASSL